MRYALVIALLLPMSAFSLPALAETCPPTDFAAADAERQPFFEALKSSETERAGHLNAAEIWRRWQTAPDPAAQEMLNEGLRRIRSADYAGAEARLDELVAYCPDYPEGWNQRAFARFLAGNYDGALADLDRTLELEPRHFGALSGRGLTLLRQGRTHLGHQAIREAMRLHPFIQERRLLPDSQKI
ncbi:MAG: tetratricopeptide repeat protein [Pseudomonadota bacterium]